MNKQKIKAVIFDCDGVMFDTAQANRSYYNEVLTHFNQPELTDEQFEKVHKATVTEAIDYLLPGIEDKSVVFDYLKQAGYHRFVKYMKMESGLIELLMALNAHGYIRGIGTNRTNTMPKVLKDFELEPYFEMVVTAADVEHPKPHPEQLHKIMERFDLEPDEVMFVGDSDYDEQAAKGAGTWFVAFKSPALDAHLHVQSMDEIAQFFGIK
ncbi:MAG: HAD family hydrolase [Desulfobacteraceae bacterium]|nr:MAG: HAD family hydrolase [Desulfobacteraceae bacterium]